MLFESRTGYNFQVVWTHGTILFCSSAKNFESKNTTGRIQFEALTTLLLKLEVFLGQKLKIWNDK